MQLLSENLIDPETYDLYTLVDSNTGFRQLFSPTGKNISTRRLAVPLNLNINRYTIRFLRQASLINTSLLVHCSFFLTINSNSSVHCLSHMAILSAKSVWYIYIWKKILNTQTLNESTMAIPEECTSRYKTIIYNNALLFFICSKKIEV